MSTANLRTRPSLAWAAVLSPFFWSCAPDHSNEPAGVPSFQRGAPAPNIQIEPRRLDFGLFQVDETASLIVRISNTGNLPLTIRQILPPDPIEPFTLQDAPRTPLVLAPGERHDLFVTFHARTAGDFRARIRIESDDPNDNVADVPVEGSTNVILIPIGEPTSPCAGRIGPNAIVGTPGDDLLVGTSGSDVILGLGGNDVIRGMRGNDLLCGGPGDDRLEGGDGNDRLDGGAGHDNRHAHAGPGVPAAGGLFGGAGDDILWGDVGNDDLNGDGPGVLAGGRDRLFGDAGIDCLFGGPNNDVLVGGADEDRLTGNEGDDILIGDAGQDQLHGGSGDDIIDGGADSDFLFGEEDDDELFGGSGVDVLRGGDGDDTLKAGDGNDYLFGDAGNDELHGGAGVDYLEGGSGSDLIDSGPNGGFWPIFDQGPDDSDIPSESIEITFPPPQPNVLLCT